MDVRLVWDQANGRADWTVVAGRVAAGADLESIVLLLLFTDRRAGGVRGWWGDSFRLESIGSRLWQLERRKIANRPALCAEADGMVLEALDPLVRRGLASSVLSRSLCPPAGPGSSGTLLVLQPTIVLPTGRSSAFQYAYTLNGTS